MISPQTLDLARQAAEDLRRRGEIERAKAIEALVDARDKDEGVPLDLVTTSEAGELLGVTGQTIKNWVREGRLRGFRIGGRIMIERDAVADYVRRARLSLDLEPISDEDAADIVAEGRKRPT